MRDNDTLLIHTHHHHDQQQHQRQQQQRVSVKNHDRLSHPLSFGKEHVCLCQDVETFGENKYSSLCSADQHKGGRVIATQRGVALDLKEFQRLYKVKNKFSRMLATRSEPSSYGHSRSRPCPSTSTRENRRQRSVSRGDPTAYVTHVEES